MSIASIVQNQHVLYGVAGHGVKYGTFAIIT